MPQASAEVQAIIDDWFPRSEQEHFSQDFLAARLLLMKGWRERAGRFTPPTPSYYGPREDYVLLRYLVEEWDYDYVTAPIIPVK